MGFGFNRLDLGYSSALRILLTTPSPDHGPWLGSSHTQTANQRVFRKPSFQVRHILGIRSSRRKSYGTLDHEPALERGFRTVLGSCEKAGDWQAG